MATKTLKAGDKVKWDTPQGETHGTVVKKETGRAEAGGHVAKGRKRSRNTA
jgi:plastocyanin